MQMQSLGIWCELHLWLPVELCLHLKVSAKVGRDNREGGNVYLDGVEGPTSCKPSSLR